MFKVNSIYLPFLFCASLTVLGCGGTEQHKTQDSVIPISEKFTAGTAELTGSMHHLMIEGGCWQFLDTSNTSYEVLGESVKSIQHEGLMATVRVKTLPRIRTVCMVGKVVELVDIVRILKKGDD